jgi:golgi SNAP receptor complex member 2
MASCAVLFPNARKIDADVARCLEEISAPAMPRPGQVKQQRTAGDAERTATEKLRELEGMVLALSKRVAYEPAAQREKWRRRVQQLEEQARFHRGSLEKHTLRRFARSKEEQERELLLSSSRVEHGGANAQALYAQESGAITRSSAMLGEYIDVGRAAFSDLRSQGGKLKSAQSKLLDIANTLGLSSSLLSVIGRRQSGDRWLVYGGMAVTLLLLWWCWGLASRK